MGVFIPPEYSLPLGPSPYPDSPVIDVLAVIFTALLAYNVGASGAGAVGQAIGVTFLVGTIARLLWSLSYKDD
ncbi:hypothetical protein [Roseobacter litoralis]|uniref:hypothetical protein n=1 Tax=Roseobacter litoralis TaxID=42443 RepID=UPI002495279D|nr:hypothetical protein [Roseobacter litoralis]